MEIIRTKNRKTCTGCGQIKFKSEFYRMSNHKNFPDGYDCRCKECRRKENRERHRKKPDGLYSINGRTMQREGRVLRIYWGDDFHVSVEISWWADGNVFPATKEQRDFLFQEMREAGYEWDAEKKELKKVEQTIEIPFGAKDSELQEATYHIPEGYHAEINGNEVVIKKGEQKTTWKPTEEQIEALEHFLETIRRYEYSYFHEETFLWLHPLLEQLKKL